MQYLISVIDNAADLAIQDEMAAAGNPEPESRALDAFNDRLVAEGYWVFAGGLAAPGTATVIDNRGGKALFTDGPFVESKEYLDGLQPEGRGAAVRVTGVDVQEAISRADRDEWARAAPKDCGLCAVLQRD